jgi:hypothetical protein
MSVPHTPERAAVGGVGAVVNVGVALVMTQTLEPAAVDASGSAR